MTEPVFQHLSVTELAAQLANDELVIADIRDPASFAAGHIKGAVLLSNDNLVDFIAQTDIDAPVVVCCYHGRSSQQAAQFLISQDFTDVYSLDGGFEVWKLQYPELVEV